MKYPLLIVLLFTAAASAYAEDQALPEPAPLVKSREAYEAKFKAAVDPLKADYLKELDQMMKSYGAQGDIASALSVEKEIARCKYPATPTTIVGKWIWDDREHVFLESGLFIGGKGKVQGSWKAVDKNARKYQVAWVDDKGRANGFTDAVAMSPDGATLSGRNNEGHTFVGVRIVSESAAATRPQPARANRKPARPRAPQRPFTPPGY